MDRVFDIICNTGKSNILLSLWVGSVGCFGLSKMINWALYDNDI